MWSRVFVITLAISIAPSPAAAHCDALDGPVVAAASRALAAKDLSAALVWVEPAAEAEVRAAFARTLEVRRFGSAAQDLADTYFFETVVRLHRAGEGEPYAGLKPAGHVAPAIQLGDRALESGALEPVMHAFGERLHDGLAQRFAAARRARETDPADLEAGRAAVTAYVEFLTYLEGLDEALAAAPAAHEEHR